MPQITALWLAGVEKRDQVRLLLPARSHAEPPSGRPLKPVEPLCGFPRPRPLLILAAFERRQKRSVACDLPSRSGAVRFAGRGASTACSGREICDLVKQSFSLVVHRSCRLGGKTGAVLDRNDCRFWGGPTWYVDPNQNEVGDITWAFYWAVTAQISSVQRLRKHFAVDIATA